MSAYTFAPGFLNGPSGRLFCLHYKPLQSTDALRPAIIHVPALAEEMNKCRRMVTLQAWKFAEEGYSVYVFDLHGSGDSSGDLEDVSWENWQQDLNFLCDYVQTQAVSKIWLWGLRGGCLLASDCLQHPHVAGGLFWQPIIDGGQVISQLQRLQRIAAGNIEEIQGRGAQEISGYTYSQKLLEQLPKISLIEGGDFNGKSLILVDVSILQESSAKEKLNNLRDALLQKGGKIYVSTVSGDPFWLTSEVTLAPNLLAETSRLLERVQVK